MSRSGYPAFIFATKTTSVVGGLNMRQELVEVIDESVETFKFCRNWLIEMTEGLEDENKRKEVIYRSLMELYEQHFLTAWDFKCIVNHIFGKTVWIYMPLDDVVGLDLRRDEIRNVES